MASSPLGWQFAAYSEIDPAACRALDAIYGCGRPLKMPDPVHATTAKDARERAARAKAVADIPDSRPGHPVNVGDMTQTNWEAYRGSVDILVGGPPCQGFSTAGLRLSLADARGNLSLSYAKAIHAIRPLWVFTENVPGWLSTKDNAFGCYLGALVGADAALLPPDGKRWGSAGIVDGPDYRAAWRVLDAQGFLPQRRKRVFVVAARVGSGGDPVGVLFETETEVERNLGERSGAGPLFPVAHGGSRDHAQSDVAGEESTGVAAGGVGRDGDSTLTQVVGSFQQNSIGGRGTLGWNEGRDGVPLHPVKPQANHQFGVLDEGNAVSVPDKVARALGHVDQSGPIEASVAPFVRDGNLGWMECVSETSSPENGFALVAECGNVPDIRGRTRVDVLQRSDEAVFLHRNKGRPDGRKSAHVQIVSAKPIVETLTTDGHSQSSVVMPCEWEDCEPLAFSSKDYGGDIGIVSPTLRAAPHNLSHANSGSHVAVVLPEDGNPTFAPPGRGNPMRRIGLLVRRLMPSECLALQGFRRDYLDSVRVKGKPLPDGPRYKLIGNSWPVPVVHWIFKRMDAEIRRQHAEGVEP